MFLNGAIWQSPSTQDPSGQVGFTGTGNLWYQTDTFNLYARNSKNTGWTLIGLVNTTNFGLLPKAGGALSGSATGSTGLMTKDGTTIPYVYPPEILNKNSQMASMADLTNLTTTLETQVSTLVSKAMALVGIPSIRANMVIKVGQVLTDTTIAANWAQTLFIPVTGLSYADGTPVQTQDCVGFASIAFANWITNNRDALTLNLQPADTQGMSWNAWSYRVGVTRWPCSINYMLIAIKPGA